jgi:1,4-alpha-glucan branching enzyme
MNSATCMERTADNLQKSEALRPQGKGPPQAPVSIYEVHPGSWMRVPEEKNRPLTVSEFAPKLARYVHAMNFTHVELLLSEPPSIITGGGDLAELIGILQDEDIGVILNGIPSGSSKISNHSSPQPGPDIHHADGYQTGDTLTLHAGESDFEWKWDRDWTRNVLYYLGEEPRLRKTRHQQLLDRISSASSGSFLLPISWGEVTAGKKSLLAKMPGDDWQKFANLRLLFAFMYAHPGKKLLFMGDEFGQWKEWNRDSSLDWHLIKGGSLQAGTQQLVAELNGLYWCQPALHGAHVAIIESDADDGVLGWLRTDEADGEVILAVFNFLSEPRHNHRIGVPRAGKWREIFNSDARQYGGSGQGNLGGSEASPLGWNFQTHSLMITLPPLGAVFLKAANAT